ncbi:putative E3 ubiquitin protein ligase DRIP1 [Dioscorea sansibarensis]
MQGPVIKEEPVTGPDNMVHTHEHNTTVTLNDKNVTVSMPPVRRRARKSHGNHAKSGEPEISAQALVDASATRNEARLTPLWFYLVASTNLEGSALLPQLSSPYLRIKFGANIWYQSYETAINQFLSSKNTLRKNSILKMREVEILCCGQQLNSTLALNDLVDIWPPTASSQRVQTHVGASAKDFVIYLSYRLKVLSS